MKKKKVIEYESGKRVVLDDDDAGELDAKWFREAKDFDSLPASIQKGLLELRKRGRPRIAAPKRIKSFRLPADLIDAIVASGKGYNSRVEKALRAAVKAGKI